METIEAAILIKNLLARLSTADDGSKHLPGVVTASELEALRVAMSLLRNGSVAAGEELAADSTSASAAKVDPQATKVQRLIPIDCHSVELPTADSDCRVCLDFGTAMSKATVVSESAGREEIAVLELGIPGDQQEVSERMLISSVYIDNHGILWFGKAAVDRSLIEGADGSRQRFDNVKRRLSEDGLDDLVPSVFNPTSSRISFEDVVLAYLMFFTWTVNRALEGTYPRNINRRFALPCFAEEKSKEVARRLRKLLGEAQVLADTFANTLPAGVALDDFLAARDAIRARHLSFPFVVQDISEPLGVAGSLLSWRTRADMLALVVDVGAGTSDFSLYRILVDPETGANDAREVHGSARAITEAGNHLDVLLVQFILKKAGVTSAHPKFMQIYSRLELQKRNHKETLFNDGSVYVPLHPDADDVQVELEEFLALEAVKQFESSLRETARDILASVDESLLGWVTANPKRYLTVVLTGGGASLPMVRSLAKGSIEVHGRNIPLQPALPFPRWLEEEYPELEEDYARIAVSLGGARKRIIARGSAIHVTAGDIVRPPKLGGYYVSGI